MQLFKEDLDNLPMRTINSFVDHDLKKLYWKENEELKQKQKNLAKRCENIEDEALIIGFEQEEIKAKE